MTTLKDGRFVFIHADRQSLLLEKFGKTPRAVSPSFTSQGTTSASKGSAPTEASSPPYPSTFQILYGGVVHAFALNAAQSYLALVCPMGSAAATSPAAIHLDSNTVRTVLRLFSFSHGEVGELIDELVTGEACNVVWVGHRHLALDVRRSKKDADSEATAAAARLPSTASTPATSVILLEVTKTPEKLKLVWEHDGAVSPVSAQGYSLCDIHVDKQTLRFWDLQKWKVTRECTLPNRRCRHGKIRMATAACSDGPFVFVVNNDWTVHGFYVERRSVRELKPMLSQFESLSVNVAKKHSDNANGKEVNDEEKEIVNGDVEESSITRQLDCVSSLTHERARPRLFVYALSDTQVLVALQGSPTILQCACEPKGGCSDGWAVVAKMRLPRRLHATCEVVGISSRGCLVRQCEGEESAAQASSSSTPLSNARTAALANIPKKSTYFVVPLEMKATGKAPVEAAVVPPLGSAVSDRKGATESSSADVKAATARDKCGTTGALLEGGSDASRTEGKRKRKKKSAGVSVDTTVTLTSPAAISASASGAGNEEADVRGRRSAVGPLQRAVARLLAHSGLSDKETFLRDFTKSDAIINRATSPATAPLPVAGFDGVDSTAGGHGWGTADVLMTAGGAAVGVVLGALVMRRFSLL